MILVLASWERAKRLILPAEEDCSVGLFSLRLLEIESFNGIKVLFLSRGEEDLRCCRLVRKDGIHGLRFGWMLTIIISIFRNCEFALKVEVLVVYLDGTGLEV